jgi:hypothetical protein
MSPVCLFAIIGCRLVAIPCPELIALLLKRFDFRGAFFGEIGPNPPCTFALLKPENRPRATISAAVEMQNYILACALCICEVIKIYDAPIRRTHKIHRES